MDPEWHIQPIMGTTTLATLGKPFPFFVQLIFPSNFTVPKIIKVELWSTIPRGNEWSAWELTAIDGTTVIHQGDAQVFSFQSSVIPAKIGLHEYTVRCCYQSINSQPAYWWATQFQKNGKLFVTDVEPKEGLKSTDVLLGIDPAWFTSDPEPFFSPPLPTPSPTESKESKSSDGQAELRARFRNLLLDNDEDECKVVLSGHLKFPVETAYWARIIPVGLVNSVGLIRRSVWWLEPNTYLGSDKPTVFFLFQRSDHLNVVLIPLTMNGVSAALLPQKDASVGVQINLDQDNDGLARIYLMVASGSPQQMVDMAVDRIRNILGPEKVLPSIPQNTLEGRNQWYDRLGLCTWNMFYKNPTHQGVVSAVDRVVNKMGIPVGYTLLDDGWQMTTQLERLVSTEVDPRKFPNGLHVFVSDLKNKCHVKQVGIWLTLQGYWNGVEPDSILGKSYQIRQTKARNNTWLIEGPDVDRFYQKFVDYLKMEGICFFKVDNQGSFDLYVNEPFYDNRPLWKAYQDTVVKHMGNDVIYSMAQSPNIIHYTYLHALNNVEAPMVVLRNSDDYHPERIDLHAGHVYTNAINNLFTAAFKNVLPDWDMFQSANPYGGFHAASRALNNGPTYLADEPDKHDEAVIRALVVGNPSQDSRILRPLLPALPTEQSLFSDARDVRTMLKICNNNTTGGNAGGLDGTSWVVGLFNCSTTFLTDAISVRDIQKTVKWRIPRIHTTFDDPVEHYALLSYRQQVAKVEAEAKVSVFLRPADFEVLTFVPIRRIMYRDFIQRCKQGSLQGVDVACFGLLNKYNGSVCIMSVEVLQEPGLEDPYGYKVVLWAKGEIAFYLEGVDKVSAKDIVVKVDGKSHEPQFKGNLMVVDVRQDNLEMVEPVSIEILCE